MSEQKDSTFDLVLNCDCIFEPLYGNSWEKLFDCQEELLRRNPSTIMITSLERRKFDGADKYLAKLEGSNDVKSVTKIDLSEAIDDDVPNEIEIYRIFGRKDDRWSKGDEMRR